MGTSSSAASAKNPTNVTTMTTVYMTEAGKDGGGTEGRPGQRGTGAITRRRRRSLAVGDVFPARFAGCGALLGLVLALATPVVGAASTPAASGAAEPGLPWVAAALAGVFFLSRGAGERGEDERSRAEAIFVANVSHELKTPVAKIQFFNQLLTTLPAEAHEKRQCYHRAIRQECERLTMLIDNVLDFGSGDRGGAAYAFADVSVARLVAAVHDRFQTLCGDRAYTLHTDVEPDLPALRADADALRQALLNLLDNALKYSDPDTLRVGARRTTWQGRPAVALSVEDHGIGIPKEKIDLIFGEFYRVDSGLSQRVSGSGLGLPLVRRVVEAHGGGIEVESEEGRGSQFTLLLPVHGPASDPPASSPST